jgi:hypothetical protein
MASNRDELFDLQQRIARLTPEDQLYLVERVLAGIRHAHFTDHEAMRKELEAMAADPGIQRVLRNEDLPYGGETRHAAG